MEMVDAQGKITEYQIVRDGSLMLVTTSFSL